MYDKIFYDFPLAQSFVSVDQTVVSSRQFSLFRGIFNRITSTEFDVIITSYREANAAATGHPLEYIIAEWKNASTVTVTFIIVDTSQETLLESTLTDANFAETLNTKFISEGIHSIEATTISTLTKVTISGTMVNFYLVLMITS